jgi:hypothetical protein
MVDQVPQYEPPGSSQSGHENSSDPAGSQFANIHFTLISIVQGVALGALATNVLSQAASAFGFDLLIAIIQTVVAFGAICLITFEYIGIFTAVRYRILGAADIVWPMAVGFAEFPLTYFIHGHGKPHWYLVAWYLAAFVLALIGYLALLHTKNNLRNDQWLIEKNDSVLTLLLRHNIYERKYVCVISISSAIFGIVQYLMADGRVVWEAGLIAIYSVLTIVTFNLMFRKGNKLLAELSQIGQRSEC